LGTFLALGTIRYEHSEAGTQVVVKENGREFVAEVTALPVT
jgi:hypothetical protein